MLLQNIKLTCLRHQMTQNHLKTLSACEQYGGYWCDEFCTNEHSHDQRQCDEHEHDAHVPWLALGYESIIIIVSQN